MRVVAIEHGWHLDHEDLPAAADYACVLGAIDADQDHGTAALGVVGAAHNAYGITGIAAGATLGVSSTESISVVNTIAMARPSLRAGDVLFIGVGYLDSPHGLTCSDGLCDQFGMVPVELVSAVFDVIRAATANGVVVVEAAGNGGMNLDDPYYGGVFARGGYESGAIMVGAGVPHYRVPEPWTNFGGRVDVQGWGEGVMTLGYGDIRIGGDDARQFYTTRFDGTSSATAIVAGAAAVVQGALLGDNRDGSLELFGIGNDDERLYHTRADRSGAFGPWRQIFARGLRFRGRVSVVSNPDGRLDVFAATSDGAIGHAWQMAPNGDFTDWFTFGGSWGSSPTAVVNADGRIEVFAEGSSGQLWHLSQVFAGGLLWSPFTSLGGTVAGHLGGSAIAAVRDAGGRLHVFARFRDNALHHIRQLTPGGGWTPWETISPAITGDPHAILGEAGRLIVFARTTSTDNRIGFSEASRSGVFSALLPVGTGGRPAGLAVPTAALNHGVLEVFVMSGDDAIWRATRSGGVWSPWSSLGGNVGTDPVAWVGSGVDDNTHLFATGPDGSVITVTVPR